MFKASCLSMDVHEGHPHQTHDTIALTLSTYLPIELDSVAMGDRSTHQPRYCQYPIDLYIRTP
jgi:hypothetical protein